MKIRLREPSGSDKVKRKMIISPCVILVESQLDQNIGKTARAMLNFGLTDLRLVRPKAPHNNKTARALSAGAEQVLEGARVFETLQEAAKELSFVLATTTRPRDMIKEVYTPRKAMEHVQAHLSQHSDHRVGLVFGPERSGLENEDIAFCDAIITAPLNPDFSSLNLAQAVVVVAYEWFQSSPVAARDQSSQNDENDPLVTQEDLHGFFHHLETELEKAGYFRTQHMKEMMTRNLRNMFARMPFTTQEIRSLRGVVASLVNPNGIYSRNTKCPKKDS